MSSLVYRVAQNCLPFSCFMSSLVYRVVQKVYVYHPPTILHLSPLPCPVSSTGWIKTVYPSPLPCPVSSTVWLKTLHRSRLPYLVLYTWWPPKPLRPPCDDSSPFCSSMSSLVYRVAQKVSSLCLIAYIFKNADWFV